MGIALIPAPWENYLCTLVVLRQNDRIQKTRCRHYRCSGGVPGMSWAMSAHDAASILLGVNMRYLALQRPALRHQIQNPASDDKPEGYSLQRQGRHRLYSDIR